MIQVFLSQTRPKPSPILRRQLSKYDCWRAVRCSLWGVVWLALGWAQAARADVWGFVDSKGVAHFASERLEPWYELYFKGDSSLEAKPEAVTPTAVIQPVDPEPPRAVAVPSRQSKLIAFFEVSPNFKAVRHHIREAAQANQIDFELLQALIVTESGFDTNAVSPKGAVGLMQLMPPTAQRYGVQGDTKTPIEKKLTDPQTNIKAGSRYLRDLIKMFPGQLELALAAYNAGEGAVQRYGNKIPPFKETQNYVVTVMQIYRQLKPPVFVAKPTEPIAAAAQQPGRVRVELGGSAGQIPGRGNMVPSLNAQPAPVPARSSTP